jgi:hypothetical protein
LQYAEGCSGADNPLTQSANGGAACTGAKLTRIVEDNLEFHTDGLPKPIYCINKFISGDQRCGWRTPLPAVTDTEYKVTTAGPQYFSTWYRDSPEYNMRAGFSAVLVPSSNPGEFNFTDTTFFPLSKNDNQIKPCTVDNRKINCTNGGKAFPTATKQSSVESDSQVFSFTSELHTFFELRGTEIFTFQGVRIL